MIALKGNDISGWLYRWCCCSFHVHTLCLLLFYQYQFNAASHMQMERYRMELHVWTWTSECFKVGEEVLCSKVVIFFCKATELLYLPALCSSPLMHIYMHGGLVTSSTVITESGIFFLL